MPGTDETIHLNDACPPPEQGPCTQIYRDVNGTEVWIDPFFGQTSTRSGSLARRVAAAQASLTPPLALRTGVRNMSPGVKEVGYDDPWKLKTIFVLWRTGILGMPAILSEVAFLSNTAQEQLLVDVAYRQQVADKIAEAITRSFGPP